METPPVMISRSDSSPCSISWSRRRASSGAIAISTGSPPACSIWTASEYMLELRICAGPRSLSELASTSTISSPVVRTATRGRTNTRRCDLPTEAASAMAASSTRVPRSSKRLPRLASAPCGTIFSPGATPFVISSGSLPSASSIRRCRESVLSVLACRLRPRANAVSAGSARCAVIPAAASSSATYRQPALPSIANATSSSRPANRASQARRRSRSAGEIWPRRTCPVSVSR